MKILKNQNYKTNQFFKIEMKSDQKLNWISRGFIQQFKY